MRVGISLTSNYPDAKDPHQGVRWMIERAAAAHAPDSIPCLSPISTSRPHPYQKTPDTRAASRGMGRDAGRVPVPAPLVAPDAGG
jgi:hypothetical protein